MTIEGTNANNVMIKLFKSDLIKLYHFDGTNFTTWKEKILFFPMELRVAYLLAENLPKILESMKNEPEETKTQ